MFIVNQDRDEIVNTDNIVRIFVENDVRVIAETSNGTEVLLGMYLKRENKANEVFKEMLDNMFIPNLIAINADILDDFHKGFKEWPIMPWGVALKGENVDIKTVERAAYYMPEE